GLSAPQASEVARRHPRLPRRCRSVRPRGRLAGAGLDPTGQARSCEIDAFTAAAPNFPGVVRTYHMAGAYDYLLHIVATDTEAVQSFVLDYLTRYPAVAHTRTNLIYRVEDGSAWIPEAP